MNKLGQKQLMAIGAVAVVLVIIISAVVLSGKKNAAKQSASGSSIQNEEVIPTVDSSVQVDLKALPGKKEVVLSVKNMPSGTKTLEYELSYEARNQGPQGVITQPIDVSNETSYEKKITLGTCSSGTCVYHDVVGSIKLSLKFTGTYGQRIFVKDYDL